MGFTLPRKSSHFENDPPRSQVTLANSLYPHAYRATCMIVSAESVRDFPPTFKTSSQEQHYFRGKKNTAFMEIILQYKHSFANYLIQSKQLRSNFIDFYQIKLPVLVSKCTGLTQMQTSKYG